MKTVTVTICTGTTCFLMGAAEFQLLEESLPVRLRPYVKVEGSHCLGLCGDRSVGEAPFVLIDGEPLSRATLPRIVEFIEKKLEDRSHVGA